MEMMPPVLNLLAIWDEDPNCPDELGPALLQSGAFDRVSQAFGWTCGIKVLRGSRAPSPHFWNKGFFVIEGEEELEAALGTPNRAIDQLEILLSRHPHELGTISGDFSFLRLEPGGNALVVRSVAGQVPIYFWQTEKRVALATRLSYLTSLAGTPGKPDELVYAMWASGKTYFPCSRSPVRNVLALPGGTYSYVKAGLARRQQSYFRVGPPPTDLPTDAEITERAGLVEQAVMGYLNARLSRTGTNLCSLSGGVDSSSILALVAGTFGCPTSAWSLVPSFEPDRSRELGYIGPLLARFDVAQHWIRFLDEETMFALLEEAAPNPFPIVQQVLMALPGLTEKADIRTVLGGEFADEAFGSVKSYPDLSMSLTPYQALSISCGPRPSVGLRWIKHQALWHLGRPLLPFHARLPALFHPRIRAEYEAWFADRKRAISGNGPRGYYFEASRDIFEAFCAMSWEACSPLDIRRLTPFFNRKVLELSATAHPWARVRDGVKTLLRRALHAHVPAKNLYRADKGYHSRIVIPKRRGQVPEALASMLAPDLITQPPTTLQGFDYGVVCALSKWLRALPSGRTGA